MRVAKMTAKTHVAKKQILQKVSGVVKPGTMTLVLGQPGSGKPSLLELLSGRLPQDKNIEVKGQVTYSGAAQEELDKHLPQFISYESQSGDHQPTLYQELCGHAGRDEYGVGQFGVISTQRSLAKMFHTTLVISLLQPSPEVFALFDDVVLNEGCVMYHGPRSQVEDFESLGFHCPPRRDGANFLLDLDKQTVDFDKQSQYEVGTVPRCAERYAEVFEKFVIHHEMLEELQAPVDSLLTYDRKQYVESLPAFQYNFFLDRKAMFAARELMLVLRNQNAIKTRLFMASFLDC